MSKSKFAVSFTVEAEHDSVSADGACEELEKVITDLVDGALGGGLRGSNVRVTDAVFFRVTVGESQ